MKKLFVLTALIIWYASVFAQTIKVNGKVMDNTGQALPGANVIIKGTTIGVITDIEGKYQLKVTNPNGSILEFKFLGMTSIEIPVNGKTIINAVLKENVVGIDEVVITALGISREAKSLSYSRQAINTEQLTETRSTNIVNNLAGKAAGVQVVQSGDPTGSTRILIRGNNSLTGNNQPLFVIDGVPINNDSGDTKVSVWNSGDDIDYGNAASQVNPDDIASIEILKGPNAAALYGSRAANGAVLITTKSAKKGDKLGIELNSNSMWTSNSEILDVQNIWGVGNVGKVLAGGLNSDAATGYPIVAKATRNFGGPLLGYNIINFNGKVGTFSPQPNNIKDFYTTGRILTNNVVLTKGFEKSSLRFSYTNTDVTWTLPGQNIQSRNNLTIRGTSDINKFMKLDANVMYTHEKVKNRVYKNGSTRNPAYSFLYMQRNADLSSYIPWKDPKGNAYGGYGDVGAINPYWLLNENSNEDLSDRLISQVSLNTKITPHLNFRVKAAGDMQFVTGWEFNNMGAIYDIDGYYRKFSINTSNINYEWLASYNKEIGKFSTVANMGGNWYDQIINGTDTRINTLLAPDVKSLANVNGIPTAVENDVRKRITSLFGSISVSYKKTAYLDATLRRDWSSSLPTAYTYPSVGGSVVFSNLLPENNLLSYGKLRASWAEVSNDASPYSLNNTYGYGGNFNGIAWVNYSTTGKNPELKPEQTRSIEFGLEAVLFKNRIKANVTHYNSSTVDQIVNASVSSTTGFSKKIYNAGEIRNKGWEVSLSGSVVNKPFKWDMDINWSKNKSLVVSLIPGVTSFELSRWFNVQALAEVGQPYGLLRGNAVRKDSQGHILVNANGRIMFDANQIIGNSEPDWIGGINNSFSYKGFSLGFLIDVKWGGEMYSATMLKATNQGIMASTLEGRNEFFFSSSVLGENDNERKGVGLYNNQYLDVERIKGFIYPNSYIGVQDPVTKAWAAGAINNNFINPQFPNVDLLNDQASLTYDASYIKLRELTIGYQLPKVWLTNTPVNEARFSLVGRNLYTLFRNTPIGLDPESTTTSGNGQGIEFGAFLPTRSYGFNIKLSF